MDHSPKTVKFTGRKPSKIQILARVKPLVSAGETFIEIQWGENWFQLDKQGLNGPWYGHGFIKDISADTVAQELNNQLKARQALDNAFNNPVEFMKKHFTIIHIQ
jgi:hypothetical protein